MPHAEERKAEEPKDGADKLIEQGEILVKIGKILKPLNDDQRRRVLRMVAAFYDIPLTEQQ